MRKAHNAKRTKDQRKRTNDLKKLQANTDSDDSEVEDLTGRDPKK